jgi:hypothetical protein
MAVLLLMSSCTHEDPVYVSYEDTLRIFVTDSADGRELFKDELFSESPFYLFDTMIVYLKIDSIIRSPIIVNIAETPRDIFPYSDIYDAVVSLTDTYYGTLFQIKNNDSLEIESIESVIRRYAYFLKLYDDSRRNQGWVYYGFGSEGRLPEGEIKVHNGETFNPVPQEMISGYGIPYYQEDNILIFTKNDSLIFSGDSALRIHAETNSGNIFLIIPELIGDRYYSGWRIPNSTAIFYNLIVFDGDYRFRFDTTIISTDPPVFSVDTNIIKDTSFVMPYKITQ